MVTVVLLVTMRLSIGCHFFYEGVWKIKHPDEFATETQGFLTQAKGPVAPLFYAMIYDLNGRERLKVEDVATADGLVAAWKKVRDDSEKRYRSSLEKALRAKLKLKQGKELSAKARAPVDKAVREFRKATTPLCWQHQNELQAYLEEQETDMAVYFAAEKKASAEKVKTWLSGIGDIERKYFQALTDYAEKDEDAKAAVGHSTSASVPKMDKDVAADRLVEDNTRLDAEGKRVLNVTIRSPQGEAIVHVGPGIKGEILLAQWDNLRRDVVRKYDLSEEQETKALEIYRDHEAGLKQYLAANLEEIAGYLGSLDRFETERDGHNNGAAFQKERAWKQMLKLRGEVKQWLSDVEKMDDAYQWALWQNLTAQQKDRGDLPLATTRADLMNFAIKYGLTAIGLCLLLGFCTRLSALGGAAFMFSVLLTQPPWPTIYPPAPAVLGHALLVDKNFVEMVALLVLASTAVGRWCGLDHFVYRHLGEPLLLRLKKEKGVTQEDEQAGESDESKS